jgi:hypothetical protein
VLVLVVVPASGDGVVVVVVLVVVLDSGIAVVVVVPVSPVCPPPQAVNDATRARLAAASAIVSNLVFIDSPFLLIFAADADRPNILKYGVRRLTKAS